MPGFIVTLDGKRLVAVSTEGLNVLTVRVHGDVIGPEFAFVDVSGGHYGDEQYNKHLIWVNEREIDPGDEVEVAFRKETLTSEPGKTIEELYPGHEAEVGRWQSVEEVFKDLAKTPKVREQFAFQVVSPSGEVIKSRTEANDHGFGFSVLWDWTHPDIARVSLTSSSLAAVENRQGGTKHARIRLKLDQSVKLRVGA